MPVWICTIFRSAANQQAFPAIHGLQTSLLSQTLTFEVHRSDFVQIINSGDNHWICLSSIGCDVDSIQFKLSFPQYSSNGLASLVDFLP